MTPPARLSAAIDILDRILTGAAAELALTQWGRANRFAGSGDRFAIRDLVFEALRRKRSLAALGGGATGRGLILGLMRQQGADLAALFTGIGHAPAVITAADIGHTPSKLEALDCPDWLGPQLQSALGDNFAAVMTAMQSRAQVFLRVNLAKTSAAGAQQALANEAIVTRTDPGCPTALEVVENHRKINMSQAYLQGFVELQDISSQAVVLDMPLIAGQKVLDFCAGGGGKTLAMAGRVAARFYAHDHHPQRMKDLPERAKRAGAKVTLMTDPATQAPYDVILCDVPCSGSGSWRRDPQGKWALTPQKLTEICKIQADILDRAAGLLQPQGVLVFATCSLLREENEDQITAFLQRHSGWDCKGSKRYDLWDRGDGFFGAHLSRKPRGNGGSDRDG